MTRRAPRTVTLDDRFLDALAAGQTVSAAAQMAGYSRRAVYDRRKADPAFGERWDEAVAVAIERLEAEADRRAVEGVLEPVFYQGIECGQVRRYSDTMLIFRLKALKPEMYRERVAIQHADADGKDLIPPETDPSRVAFALLSIVRGVAEIQERGEAPLEVQRPGIAAAANEVPREVQRLRLAAGIAYSPEHQTHADGWRGARPIENEGKDDPGYE